MADDSGQEIPEGTVTVLFTDLVESTRLNQSLGDDAARAIGSQVEQMARRVVSGNRGVLIKEMGDGRMAAFASARRAVAAAREIQVEMGRLHRGGFDEAVQMRIGLHTGDFITADHPTTEARRQLLARIIGTLPAWHAQAACRGADRDIMFPRHSQRATAASPSAPSAPCSSNVWPTPWPT